MKDLRLLEQVDGFNVAGTRTVDAGGRQINVVCEVDMAAQHLPVTASIHQEPLSVFFSSSVITSFPSSRQCTSGHILSPALHST